MRFRDFLNTSMSADSMFRLALVGLGGAKSACLVVERSQSVLRQSLLSSAALRFTEVHRGARYGVLALAYGEEEEEEEETMEES